MATTAQTFYHSTTEQDFTASGEVDIRKLVESAPGSNATTICTHPNSASTTQITLDPYTNSSTQSDIRANAGWAINRLGTDGMVSTSTTNRIIPAGTWTFVLTLSLPTAGGVVGNLTGSFIAAVYRVSSTGTRTQLFTATSNTGQSTGTGAFSGNLTATVNPGAITLAPNETLHVGYLSNVIQNGGLLGATVSGVATWTVGTSTQFVQVASPGVRTLYFTAIIASAAGVIAKFQRKISKIIPRQSSAEIASLTRRATLKRNLVAPGAGQPTLTKRSILRRTLSSVANGKASAFLKLPFGKVPNSGSSGTTNNYIFPILD